jgi:hypothetical protein
MNILDSQVETIAILIPACGFPRDLFRPLETKLPANSRRDVRLAKDTNLESKLVDALTQVSNITRYT